MKYRRTLIPIVMALVFLLQFFPGTSLGPHSAAAVTCTNLAQFIADVTIPDGTTVSPGAAFTKTWRLQNAGTCTWTTSYAVQFISGTNMAASQTLPLPAAVAPGGTVDITTNMTAPAAAGHYRANYELKTDTGTLFGVGASASFLFWVDINVGTTLTSAYDFAANAASATWTSGAGALTFPGTDGDVKGFALPDATPKLENGTTATNPGIIVNPQQVTGGFIQGKYPAFTVQAGDHFQSIVNCTFNATNCYVNFRLAYQIGSGPVNTLWSFNERREGLFFRANIDLSSLAGQSVNFILYVADVPAHGVPSGDRAEWVGPMVVRGGGGGTPIPPATVCDRGFFVGDVTIPDGTTVAPGQTFTKTWRIKNVGSCTWTTSYDLVFVLGNTFGAAPVTAFSPATVSVLPVAPGQTADFSLNMVAPTAPGHYRSFWRFQNAANQQFGVGSGMVTFFADINVATGAPTLIPGGPTPTQIISGPNADLSVTKNDGLSVYQPGGTVTYTITVSNSGPSNVTGATFLDNKPSPHVTSWTWTCTPDAGASCTTGPTTSAVNIMDTVNLPVGTKIVYNVVATINPSAVGNLINTASITNPAAVPDPNLANNSATDTDMPPSTDLTVNIGENVSMYTLGGQIIYTVQLNNIGPLPVTGATFSDPKPSQITSWNWVCSATSGAVWSGPGTSTGNVTATVNMPVGSGITCTVTANISSAATGDLVNTVTITPPASVPDSIPANNTKFVTATGPNADLQVTKDDGVTFYTPGGTLTYTVVVKNNGPLIVNGATFTDNMPSQITGWTWSCVADTGALCPNAAPTAAVFTDTLSIPAGNKVVYTVVANVSPTATGSIVNTATVQSIASIPDLNPLNNSATDTDTPPSADLAILQKTDGVQYYPPGGTVTYTIDVKNNGPQDVVGAVFTDNLPASGLIAQWIWSCAPTTPATVVCHTGPFTTNASVTDTVNIPAGVTIRYTVVASIAAGPIVDLVNTATITLPAGMSDPNLANNSATDTDQHPKTDLELVSISDQIDVYNPGHPTIYTIVVKNNGPSPVIGATLTSTFPGAALLNSWTWTCVATLGGSCSNSATNLIGNFTDTALNLPAGATATYTVVANVAAAATGILTVMADVEPPTAPPQNVVIETNPTNNVKGDTDTFPFPYP